MKTALLFAGQATQYVGMGKHLIERFSEAAAIFDEADEALGQSLTRIILDGPEDLLNLTENTQPAVLTVACAAHAVLKRRGFEPSVVAGHSLGEYGALVAAGALQFADAVRLTRRRGLFMQSAVPPGAGAMAAIQRLDADRIEAACAAASGYCVPAVFNAPNIIVISGERDAVEETCRLLASDGGIVTPLAVSAPFHCELLQPAALQLELALNEVEFGPLQTPYIANFDAQWVSQTNPMEIRNRLVNQVVGAVRWSESITLMLERGVERFWHLGPGRANLSHVKRQARRAPTATTDRDSDLNQIIDELSRA